MKPKKTISIYVLLIGVMGLSIVGGILAFQIFSAATKTQLTTEQRAAIKPIDGTISQKVVDNLTQRSKIGSTDINALQLTKAEGAPEPTPTPEELIPATESAEPTL